jgi:guanylate kinase
VSKFGMVEVKQLLQYNPEFRKIFPELKDEINKFLKCRNCPSDATVLRKILEYKDRITDYLAGKAVVSKDTLKDEFKVINATIDKLEEELKLIPIGSRVESLARSGSEVTAIIRIPR